MAIPKLRFKEFILEYLSCTIGDTLSIKHGKDYKHLTSNKKLYPVYGTGGIITYVDEFLCDWNCVCIGRKGTIDIPRYMDRPFWSVDTLFYSKPKENNLPKYQYYLFQRINWKQFNEASGVPSLSATTIENIKINIPSCNEQKKIADFLSLLDRKIALQEKKIALLKDYKKGVFESIRNSIKETVFLYNITTTHTSNKRISIVDDAQEQTYPIYDATGILGYIPTYDMEQGYVSIIKDGAGVGRLNLCSSKSSFIATLTALTPIGCELDYLYFALQTINFKKYITGSTIPHIYYKDYSKEIVPFPIETKRSLIAKTTNFIDKSIYLSELKTHTLRKLKSALLQQMFV